MRVCSRALFCVHYPSCSFLSTEYFFFSPAFTYLYCSLFLSAHNWLSSRLSLSLSRPFELQRKKERESLGSERLPLFLIPSWLWLRGAHAAVAVPHSLSTTGRTVEKAASSEQLRGFPSFIQCAVQCVQKVSQLRAVLIHQTSVDV